MTRMAEAAITDEHADALFALNELHDFFRNLEAVHFETGLDTVEFNVEQISELADDCAKACGLMLADDAGDRLRSNFKTILGLKPPS